MISYEISASAITTASPTRVLAVLDDFRHWPAWMPSMENIRVELPDGLQPGLGYRFRLRGRITHGDMEVVDFTPMSRGTTFRISFPPFTGVNRCRLVPLPDGRHRIERVDSLHLPDLIAHLIDATQRKRFERLAGEFIDALKREVEGPARG